MGKPEGLDRLEKIFGTHRVSTHADATGTSYILNFTCKTPDSMFDSDTAAKAGMDFAGVVISSLTGLTRDMGIHNLDAHSSCQNGEMLITVAFPAKDIENIQSLKLLRSLSHLNFKHLEVAMNPELAQPESEFRDVPPPVAKTGNETPLQSIQSIFPQAEWKLVNQGTDGEAVQTKGAVARPDGVMFNIDEALGTYLPVDKRAVKVTIPTKILTAENLEKLESIAPKIADFLKAPPERHLQP